MRKISIKKAFFSLIGLFLIIAPANAQRSMTEIAMDSTLNDHKVIYFGKGEEPARDSTLRVIARFYQDQFRHFQDPLAPYFLFMSKDNNLAMGVGGVVRMRGYYDWGGSVPSPAFAPYLIPMTKDPTKKRDLATTPAGTALFFRVIGRNKKLGNYQLYIEANFNGYQARDFHLKKAYGQINDFTIGYTNSTFSDPGAMPPTVDAGGPNSKMDATAVLVRYLHEFRSGWSLAGSVETPSNAGDFTDGMTSKVNQYIPDIAAFGQYSFTSSNYLRLSAIMRNHPYRDVLQQKNYNVTGWGLQLTGRMQPDTHFTIYGCFNGGQGYQSLGGDWMMGKYDLVDTPYTPGRMYCPASIGGYIGIQYNLNPSMFFTATYSGTKYMPKDNGFTDEYKTGQYLALNYFWYMTPRMSCAAEFNLGRRENMDGRHAWARRAGLLASFSF